MEVKMSKSAKVIWGTGALVPVIALLSVAPQPAQARELDQILSSKEIHLGYVNYPPLTVRDAKTGKLSGFVVEALNYVFGTIKLKPVWIGDMGHLRRSVTVRPDRRICGRVLRDPAASPRP